VEDGGLSMGARTRLVLLTVLHATK
jgi:hypothetical protein